MRNTIVLFAWTTLVFHAFTLGSRAQDTSVCIRHAGAQTYDQAVAIAAELRVLGHGLDVALVETDDETCEADVSLSISATDTEIRVREAVHREPNAPESSYAIRVAESVRVMLPETSLPNSAAAAATPPSEVPAATDRPTQTEHDIAAPESGSLREERRPTLRIGALLQAQFHDAPLGTSSNALVDLTFRCWSQASWHIDIGGQVVSPSFVSSSQRFVLGSVDYNWFRVGPKLIVAMDILRSDSHFVAVGVSIAAQYALLFVQGRDSIGAQTAATSSFVPEAGLDVHVGFFAPFAATLSGKLGSVTPAPRVAIPESAAQQWPTWFGSVGIGLSLEL